MRRKQLVDKPPKKAYWVFVDAKRVALKRWCSDVHVASRLGCHIRPPSILTLKRYLAKQPPAASLAELQLQIDTFRPYYNQQRPHRALNGQTPLMAFNARLKARPEAPPAAPHLRVRHDTVDKAGRVTLRYLSHLRHIGIGRYYIGARITLLVAGAHIRVVDEDGGLIRELILDPTKDYQPLETACGRPKIGHYVPRQVGTIT